MVENRRIGVIVIATVAILYSAMEAVGITCPIKYVTGISCAGCGMSRAWLAALSGDIAGAMAYHPLFLAPVLVAGLLLFRNRIPSRVLYAALIAIAAIFALVYMYRMLFEHGDIVVFEPANGVIGRRINAIMHLI